MTVLRRRKSKHINERCCYTKRETLGKLPGRGVVKTEEYSLGLGAGGEIDQHSIPGKMPSRAKRVVNPPA